MCSFVMAIGTAFFVVAILVVAIWVLIELKRMRHKFFAFFLIALILFSYLSFTIVLKDSNVNLKTIPGIIDGGKLYFSWLGSLFGNAKSITSHAVALDWTGENKTESS